MEKTINIIIPYFGRFPSYFPLFLQSCRYNNSVDWTIITDNEEVYDYPKNVKKIKSTFGQMRTRIESAFGFETEISELHKLCEYKPAYGYLFPELIEGYDFWGYGDLDVVYGNIRSFLSEEILSYPKIFQMGHLTFIKNEKKFNEMFMNPIDDYPLFERAFSSPDNFNFDETFMGKPNINQIFENEGYHVWKKSYAADIYTRSSDFHIVNDDGSHSSKKYIFIWNHGKLFGYTDTKEGVQKTEFLYVHLQKRRMNIRVSTDSTVFKIIPNSFDKLEVSEDNVESSYKVIKKKYINMHYFRLRYANLKVKVRRKWENCCR